MYYDFWRILCVLLVVITHADEVYAEWNVLGVQQWVLPILTIISGALFAESRQSTLSFAARLLTYFSLGVLLNGAAAMLMGIEWHGAKFGDVVLFQIAFVLLFVSAAIVAAPLRNQLARKDVPWTACLSITLYAASLPSLLLVQLLLWQRDVTSFDQLIRVSAEVFVTAFLAAILTYMLPGHHRGFAGWALAVWMYGTRIVYREPRPGSDIHYIDLYIWAFYVQKVPLAGQALLGQIMARAWPLWAVACGLLLTPGISARVDEQPFDSASSRLRQYLPELIAVLAFTSIPSAGRDLTLPFPETIGAHMAWLSRWSLAAFVSHKAVYYMVQPIPYGLALVLVAMPALAYFFWGNGAVAGVHYAHVDKQDQHLPLGQLSPCEPLSPS